MHYPRFLTVITVLLLSLHGRAQQFYTNWYFGEFAGLTFNTSPPTLLAGGQINTQEGCAGISDSLGNLLFYTDGITVWDRNHQVMPNGTGLSGGWSSAQSALIVPVPGSASRYYLFTLGDATIVSSGELDYSVVDMHLNNGLGDLDAAEKKIFLTTNLTEKLVSANYTGCGIWVITHQRNNNRFEARLISGKGIGEPVFSNTGSIHSADPPNGDNGLTGMMKVSKNNLKIGLANLQRVIELFDFDPATGILSNPIALPMAEPNIGYGVCFSPDNSKFYITEGQETTTGYKIYQYDLSSGIAASIIASRKFLGDVGNKLFWVGDMQIGPDNQIYFVVPETQYLGVIPKPNLPAPLCGFNSNAIFLGAGKAAAGLPNEIRYVKESIPLDLVDDTTLCMGKIINLSAPDALTYNWSTGATTQSITVSMPGKYWLNISNEICSFTDTINILPALQTVHLGKDTILCRDQSILLDAGMAGSYQWSTGATSQTIQVNTAGQYWVKASDGDCFKSDTINISKSSTPNCDCVLLMPNAFSPNTDGVNDFYKPAQRGACQFLSFTIFNRWGQKVYETSDLNNGWNGKYAGVDQDSGVYIWQVLAVKDGVNKIFKGTVMLIR